MSAGVRSPLAFWVGGAGRPPRAHGVRSLLAFWLGGAYGYTTPVVDQVPGGGPIKEPIKGRIDRRRRRPDDLPRRHDIPARVPVAPDVETHGAPGAERFDAAELAAAVSQVTAQGGFPATVVLPTRTIDTNAATDEDMAFLMFAFFMATDD